jgi:hypothetical protein
MGRPHTKGELLSAAREEFDRLWTVVAKDVLAHLDGWHELFLEREAAGSRGEKPPVPASGFDWAETPAFNEAIYQRDQVLERVETELFTRKRSGSITAEARSKRSTRR